MHNEKVLVPIGTDWDCDELTPVYLPSELPRSPVSPRCAIERKLKLEEQSSNWYAEMLEAMK